MKIIDPLERHLFLEAVYGRYGYDFRQYSEASLNRRLGSVLQLLNAENLVDVLKEILASPAVFQKILPSLTISTTEFFRDPKFFRALREQVFPVLKTYPTIKIWAAGCSTGEEIYSLAVALREEGLAARSMIYATDINPKSLKIAKDGIYNVSVVEKLTRNYVLAGGNHSPSDYYTSEYGLVRLDPTLKENVVFMEHNLATDAVFGEFHLVLCRNVLIYFRSELQDRAIRLFEESLVYRGFLGLGSKESLRFSAVAPAFEDSDASQKIFRLKAKKSLEKVGKHA